VFTDFQPCVAEVGRMSGRKNTLVCVSTQEFRVYLLTIFVSGYMKP
jgi:hypothetical protein